VRNAVAGPRIEAPEKFLAGKGFPEGGNRIEIERMQRPRRDNGFVAAL
jgi:hypothetical protein